MICLKKIHKTFDEQLVIDDFSYTFEEGKTYQILGDSGIGKTTLLRIMMGLEKATSGEVIYEKSPLTFAPVFQESRLVEDKNSILNVQLVNRKLPKEEIKKALEEILPPDSLLKPVKELSGGMRRRLEIARSLLSKNLILVMDEPFASLDKENIEGVINFIEHYREGRTLIFTSHVEIKFPGTIKVSFH